jgi:hypothetical protein
VSFARAVVLTADALASVRDGDTLLRVASAVVNTLKQFPIDAESRGCWH